MGTEIITSSEFEQDQPVKQALIEACRKRAGLVVGKDVPAFIKGQNIFLGIGLISGSGRVSKGLGLGFVNMAVLARTIQKEISENDRPSKIIALVADTHALTQAQDVQRRQEIMTAASAVESTTQKIFSFLGCPAETVQIIKSSSNFWNSPSSTDYLEQEIKDIVDTHRNLGCGVKVGWQTKRQKINGGPIYDEQFFDHEAIRRNPLELADMAFVRGPEWLSLQTHDGGDNLPLPPYFADKPNFVLGKPIQFEELNKNGAFTKQMSTQLARMESGLKATLGNQNISNGLTNLQSLVDFCWL